MSDLIERQAAKEVGRMTRAEFIERLKKLIEEAENDERTEKSSQNVSNDDLISRKAAIDALEELKIRYFDRKVIIGKTQDVINNLPSVQPERTCVNCGRTANNGGWYADG